MASLTSTEETALCANWKKEKSSDYWTQSNKSLSKKRTDNNYQEKELASETKESTAKEEKTST